MRSVLLFVMIAVSATATAIAQPVPTGPGKVMTGLPGLPSVEPYSNRASNINSADTHSVIAPALPALSLGPNATAADYLKAALNALAANHTGQAQTALENAETLLLTRSVPEGTTGIPDQSPAVRGVQDALQSLGSGNVQAAMNRVQQTCHWRNSRRTMRTVTVVDIFGHAFLGKACLNE